jgi:hypothetical protein
VKSKSEAKLDVGGNNAIRADPAIRNWSDFCHVSHRIGAGKLPLPPTHSRPIER